MIGAPNHFAHEHKSAATYLDVAAPSLHARVVQSYSSQSWLQFWRMFVPHYLREGNHPYHHHDDEVIARHNSRIVTVAELDTLVRGDRSASRAVP